MRATERLLEVIDELATAQIAGGTHPASEDRRMQDIVSAVRELRRRGDTLVRRDDLRLVIEEPTDPRWQAAYDRLEIALGGKLR